MSTYRNTVTLKGYLGRDAELHVNTNQTPFAVLSLATKSTHRNKQSGEFVSHTEWHRVIANGRLAESAKSLLKGAHVEVQGRLQSYRYEDNAGAHTFDIVRDSVTIGRGGIAYPADVRIDASIDVSREHARIRRDAQSGAFFIVDLSTLGTTVNGRRVPKGYDEVDGTKKENGIEAPLTTGSRIGLADTVYLDFEIPGRQ